MQRSKAKAKEIGVTFNDLMLGISTKAVKQHFIANNDPSESITINVPFTFQTIPRDITKYKFGNNFILLTLYVDLKDNLKDACHSAKSMMDKFKNTMIPVGGYTLLQFYSIFCPHFFMNHLFH